MKKRIEFCVVAVVLLVLSVVFCGCAPKEPKPEECNYCDILGNLLDASMGNTERAIQAGQKLSASKDELQTELLKANTEIAECWKIIEASKPDPNTPPVWGKGDLDPNWVALFGDDNNARLDYVNTERINRLAPAVDEMAKRLMALELENPAELAERVRKLEAGDEGCPFEKMSGVRCEELPVREHSHTGTVTDPNIPKEVENAVEKGEIPKDNQ